jgi:hypothetical protein
MLNVPQSCIIEQANIQKKEIQQLVQSTKSWRRVNAC